MHAQLFATSDDEPWGLFPTYSQTSLSGKSEAERKSTVKTGTMPLLHRSVPFQYWSFIKYQYWNSKVWKRTSIGQLLYRSFTVPLQKGPVFYRYNDRCLSGTISFQYRSLPLQYRSFSPVLERYLWGLFWPVRLPVLFRSVRFGPIPFRSFLNLMEECKEFVKTSDENLSAF